VGDGSADALRVISWAVGLSVDEYLALADSDPDIFREAKKWREGALANVIDKEQWLQWSSQPNVLLQCDPNGVPLAPFSEGQLKQFETNQMGTAYFLVAWWAAAARKYRESVTFAIREHNALAAARNATNLATTYLAAGQGHLAQDVCFNVLEFTARSSLGGPILGIRQEAITLLRMCFVSTGAPLLASNLVVWLTNEPPETMAMSSLVRRDVSKALRSVGRENEACSWEALYDEALRLAVR